MELISRELILLLFLILWSLWVNFISVLDLFSDMGLTIKWVHVRLTKNFPNLILNILCVCVIVKTVLLICWRMKIHILEVQIIWNLTLFCRLWSWNYFRSNMSCKGIHQLFNIQIGNCRTHYCSIKTSVQILYFSNLQINF